MHKSSRSNIEINETVEIIKILMGDNKINGNVADVCTVASNSLPPWKLTPSVFAKVDFCCVESFNDINWQSTAAINKCV